MSSPKHTLDMGFTPERFPDCHHMCLIFDGEAERRKIVSEFLAAGLRQKELVRYFADTTPAEEVRTWLLDLGLELGEDTPFGVVSAAQAYCPSGHFDPQAVIDGMLARYAMADKAGYSGSRVTGEMTWALKDIPGANRLLEYEALINAITEAFPHIGMCQYDVRRFDGATLFKVLQVHPYLIAQGQIIKNPFYMRPDEFLKELGAKPA
jgi:hypothetical protein